MKLIDFALGKTVKTEEDVKVKIVVPYLLSLGYDNKDLRFENVIPVQVGTRKVPLRSDIEIMVDGHTEIVIDVKSPSHTINDADLLQASSYAKLVDKNSSYLAFVTNGHDLKGINVIFNTDENDIPSSTQLVSLLSRRPKKIFTDIELGEVRSALITLMSQDDLYNVIRGCKDTIEKQALIRSDQSFREMTKILLVKMNEERRAVKEGKQNRFSVKWLDTASVANGTSFVETFKALFAEATKKYEGIYSADDPGITITDEDALRRVVSAIEPFSFTGTGEDIKGAVYEIFLKSTLRGDFDQYFTPRELVDYIISAADPEVGDKFVDPAAGSGGFLIKAFTHVTKKIRASHKPQSEILADEKELVEKYIWGQEADYDLHVLTKINMIMHGDGWNNIYQGDSLLERHLPENAFSLVLENPPFTIPFKNQKILQKYELGLGRDAQELDILFVELSIRLLKEGGRMFIILPEGLLNLNTYLYFRQWLLSKVWISQVISLPAGAFQPFGRSASKTCILSVIKKGAEITPPKYVFGAIAQKIGYDTGKTAYRKIPENDLDDILNASHDYFVGVKYLGQKGAAAAWCSTADISPDRIDAGAIINMSQKTDEYILLRDMFTVDDSSFNRRDLQNDLYVEIPWVSEINGCIQRVEHLTDDVKSNTFHVFNPGEIFVSRINPSKRRIGMIPTELSKKVVMSQEVYAIRWHDNEYLDGDARYAIISILRDPEITKQICSVSTGSSSSRARISKESLENIRIPLKMLSNRAALQKKSDEICQAINELWIATSRANSIM